MKLYLIPIAPNGTDRRVLLNGTAVPASGVELAKPGAKPRAQIVESAANAAFELRLGKKKPGDQVRERRVLSASRAAGGLRLLAGESMRKRVKERANILRYRRSRDFLHVYRQGHIVRIALAALV